MLASLLLGTAAGVYRVGGGGPTALHGQLITHLACTGSGAAAAAAVPTPGPVHGMYKLEPAAPQDSGLHLLRHSAADGYTAERVWAGDARSCCIWDLPGGQEQGTPTSGGAAQGSAVSGSRVGLAVGTEPADVFVSLDGGGSWSPGTSSFQTAPSRPSWSFPAPPHEPHVLSLERTASGQLVVGIEVGGVLVGGSGAGLAHFEEHNEGLYADVHSCRIDPHNPRHWLAVTGRGLYASDDAGTSWRAQGSWKGRYTIGLAFSPLHQGEVLLAAGDRPPALGVHLYHSTDGGNSFQDITDAAFSGDTAEAKGSRTPVPYFVDGQALLGTATGHLLASDHAERRSWRIVDHLPHPILCMCAPAQSPSSVMH